MVLASRSGSWLRRKLAEPPKCPHGSFPRILLPTISPPSCLAMPVVWNPHGGSLITRKMVYICRGPACSNPDHPSSSLTASPFIHLSHCNHDWSRTSNHGHSRILRLLAHSRGVCQKGKGPRSQGGLQTYALPVGYDCTQVSYHLKLQSQTTNAN
jgi:hypothetical protein